MAPKGKAKPSKATPRDTAATPSALPNWPPLFPLVPTSSLSIETLLEDQILLIHNLFTSSLCRNYISFLSSLPLTTTPGKPKRDEASRFNDRFQIQDPSFAERLWKQTALHELVTTYFDPALWGGQVLGLNPNIRVYRYSSGQFFDQHYDESNRLTFGPEAVSGLTTWTLLIYLSTCEGGQTVFYPEGSGRKGGKAPDPVVAELEVGLALLHKHGDDCLLHEGKEVTRGDKWVLRSDLVVRRWLPELMSDTQANLRMTAVTPAPKK